MLYLMYSLSPQFFFRCILFQLTYSLPLALYYSVWLVISTSTKASYESSTHPTLTYSRLQTMHMISILISLKRNSKLHISLCNLLLIILLNLFYFSLNNNLVVVCEEEHYTEQYDQLLVNWEFVCNIPYWN